MYYPHKAGGVVHLQPARLDHGGEQRTQLLNAPPNVCRHGFRTAPEQSRKTSEPVLARQQVKPQEAGIVWQTTKPLVNPHAIEYLAIPTHGAPQRLSPWRWCLSRKGPPPGGSQSATCRDRDKQHAQCQTAQGLSRAKIELDCYSQVCYPKVIHAHTASHTSSRRQQAHPKKEPSSRSRKTTYLLDYSRGSVCEKWRHRCVH